MYHSGCAQFSYIIVAVGGSIINHHATTSFKKVKLLETQDIQWTTLLNNADHQACKM